MGKAIQTVGFAVTVIGVSGTIDHLAYQPIMGFLNFANRFVFPKMVPGYELYANLGAVALGLILLFAGGRATGAK